MSLVISYVDKDGTMWIGADSCGSGNMTKAEYKNRKLFNVKGDVLVGVVGSFLTQNAISANLSIFKNAKSARKDLVSKIVPALMDMLDEETMSESCLLVLFNKRIFVVQGDFSVTEVADNHKCIGNHGFAADTMIDILNEQNSNGSSIGPEEIMLTIFTSILKYGDGIGAPFYITNTGDNKMRKYATTSSEPTIVTGGW